jgi:hypothetical protein
MLKLTYTEGSFYLECLNQSLEQWVAQRVVLAMRVGQSLSVEPSTASFLLPVDLPGVDLLQAAIKQYDSEIIALCACDTEYIEVTLRGSWLSESSETALGVFVTTISDAPNNNSYLSLNDDLLQMGESVPMSSRLELFLHQLWQEAQVCASVMRE